MFRGIVLSVSISNDSLRVANVVIFCQNTAAYKTLFLRFSNASFCGWWEFFMHPPSALKTACFYISNKYRCFVLCCRSILFEIRMLSQLFFDLCYVILSFFPILNNFFDTRERMICEFVDVCFEKFFQA